MRLSIAVLTYGAILAGCATSATVDRAPLGAGRSMEFSAPAARVAAAAATTLSELKLDVEGSKQQGASTVINFKKGISPFSWGEVGRVVVTPAGSAATSVHVHTEKRDRVQITGTSEAEFAEEIFNGIRKELSR